MADLSGLVSEIHKKTPTKFGVICVNCILHNSPLENLIQFLKQHSIYLPESTLTIRSELVYYIYYHFFTEFQSNPDIRKTYSDPVTYIGDIVSREELFKFGMEKHDFIAKHELIDVFADFCADLGIITFEMDPQKETSSQMDLFLTKRVPLLKTEAVFVRTGRELENGGYSEELLQQIKEASKKAIWTVFVTTSYGAHVVGLKKLIKDMESLNVWLYVVDPLHKNVYGVTKGFKNKLDETLRAQLESSLPSQPIRAPSQLGNISKYAFSERDSYNSKRFTTYSILKSDIYGMYLEKQDEDAKFRSIFRSLLIIDPITGLNIYSLKSDTQKVDDVILSGFLSAIDSLASEIGTKQEGIREKEINYQGFIVQIISGDLLNAAMFLTKPANQILKERMMHFITRFEEVFAEPIADYKASGITSVFPENRITDLAKDLLLI